MKPYWSNERGRYGTGESYDWFPKYEDGVSGIGDYAFFNCVSLKELTIPESVIEFGTDALGIMEIREYISPEKDAFRIKGYQTIPGFKIKGKAGSRAEEYAKEKGIEFVRE